MENRLYKTSIYILLVAIVLQVCSCQTKDPNKYYIEGKLSNIDSGYFYAVREIKDSLIVDTIHVDEKGKFEFSSEIDSLTFVSLYFNDNTKFAYIVVDKGWDVVMTGDALLTDIIEVKGGDINDDLTSFKEKNKNLLRKRAEILNSIDNANETDSLTSKGVGELQNINFELSNIAEAYIKANPSKIASVLLINTFFKDESFIPRLDECLEYLRGKAEIFPLTIELKKYSNKVKTTQVGSIAPNFTLPNAKDKKISLTDYRGKYVILTFDSSTCDACNLERIEAIKAYNTLKKEKREKEVDFLTVMVNTEVKQLSKNMSDSIKWEILPEKGYWAAKTLNTYNVRALPNNFLISPNGTILSKNLPMVELIEKLDDYLPKKANDGTK